MLWQLKLQALSVSRIVRLSEAVRAPLNVGHSQATSQVDHNKYSSINALI